MTPKWLLGVLLAFPVHEALAPPVMAVRYERKRPHVTLYVSYNAIIPDPTSYVIEQACDWLEKQQADFPAPSTYTIWWMQPDGQVNPYHKITGDLQCL